MILCRLAGLIVAHTCVIIGQAAHVLLRRYGHCRKSGDCKGRKDG